MIELPKLGSSKRGRAHVLSVPLKEDFSRLTGVSREEANLMIDALGAVIQDRLLRGLPCGIPFFGVLYVKFNRDRCFHVDPIKGRNKNRLKEKTMVWPIHASPALYCSRVIKEAIRDNSPFTGDLVDFYKNSIKRAEEILAIERRRKRTLKKYCVEKRYVHPTATPEGRAKRKVRERKKLLEKSRKQKKSRRKK